MRVNNPLFSISTSSSSSFFVFPGLWVHALGHLDGDGHILIVIVIVRGMGGRGEERKEQMGRSGQANDSSVGDNTSRLEL